MGLVTQRYRFIVKLITILIREKKLSSTGLFIPKRGGGGRGGGGEGRDGGGRDGGGGIVVSVFPFIIIPS